MNAANVMRDIACIVPSRGTQMRPALPQNCCALVVLGLCRYVCPLGAVTYCLNLILIAIGAEDWINKRILTSFVGRIG